MGWTQEVIDHANQLLAGHSYKDSHLSENLFQVTVTDPNDCKVSCKVENQKVVSMSCTCPLGMQKQLCAHMYVGYQLFNQTIAAENYNHTPSDTNPTVQTQSPVSSETSSNSASAPITKQMRWERKLLDLSLRNMLLNVRYASVVPVLANQINDIENTISEGKELIIAPLPKDWNEVEETHAPAETPAETVPAEAPAPVAETAVAEPSIISEVAPSDPGIAAEAAPEAPVAPTEELPTDAASIESAPVEPVAPVEFSEPVPMEAEAPAEAVPVEPSAPVEAAEPVKAEPVQYNLENITGITDAHQIELLTSALSSGKLISPMDEITLNKLVTKRYRSTKHDLEETGVNSLFLAFGMLKWREDPFMLRGRAASDHYAPVILTPVDIIRKSSSKGYAIRIRDEEPMVNATLLELLKEDFNLIIEGLDTLPKDDSGLYLDGIFEIFRNAIADRPEWSLVENCVIGNFSFAQFIMWNDIHTHPEFLQKHKIVRSLIDNEVKVEKKPEGEASEGTGESTGSASSASVPNSRIYLPVPVDGSQLKGVQMSLEDSFVLHGPPGTGKSQTITAMISNAMAHGKTVLFVAEKQAALDVVQRNLAAIGLDPFCMELYSAKSTKKHMLTQLNTVLELPNISGQSDYEKHSKALAAEQEELEKYVTALHAPQNCGFSVRELIDAYEAIEDTGMTLSLPDIDPRSIDADTFAKHKRLLDNLYSAGQTLPNLSERPFREVKRTEYSQTFRNDLESSLKTYRAALSSARSLATDLSASIGAKEAYETQGTSVLTEIENAVKAKKQAASFPPEWISAPTLDTEFAAAGNYLTEKEKFAPRQSQMQSTWKPEILQMDMDGFLREYEDSEKRLLGKDKAKKKVEDKLQAYANAALPSISVPAVCDSIKAYQQEAQRVDGLYQTLSPYWKNCVAKYDSLAKLAQLRNYTETIRSANQAANTRFPALADQAGYSRVAAAYDKYAAGMQAVDAREQELSALLECPKSDLTALSAGDSSAAGSFDAKLALCDRYENNLGELRKWILFNQAEKECADVGLAPVCTLYTTSSDPQKTTDTYRRTLYRILASDLIEQSPVLNRFTGDTFEESIRRYKYVEEECQAAAKQEILKLLSSRLPTRNEEEDKGKEMNFIRRAIKSNGRGVSIRSLFEQAPNMIRKLCPCMLMSPLSVAQYLPPENDLFDLVLFDEASQLPTCKAVGVIARGKNAVIVGDPNQMPPTTFFQINTFDEENVELEDLDSILDDCLALGLSGTHLKWHYRSRHESLIAFSNYYYYENKMMTFPSVNDRECRVSMVLLDGVYKRNANTNPVEAKAIVEEIRRRYEDPELKNQSIGVVTFNQAQQEEIEDLLRDEFAKDTAFDEWAGVGLDTKNSLFVKNLENVQGDERDVILFSVTYGPDEKGNFTLNFGPLNKDDGWKRLNVAASRAKYSMVVFSSITADMIDAKRSKAKGVDDVRNFLRYAQNGTLSGRENTSVEPADPDKKEGIQEVLCREIENAGFTVETNIGRSQFKVDIAVRDPRNEGKYLLGILLDGKRYKNAGTTRDREIGRTSVLENLGWQLLRVWTMDFWDNKEEIIMKVMKKLDQLNIVEEEPVVEAQAVVTVDAAPETEVEPAVEAEAVEAPEVVVEAPAVEETPTVEEVPAVEVEGVPAVEAVPEVSVETPPEA